MITREHSFKAAQTSIVREMFIHTADENYVVARWAAAHGLQTDFLWNALHALEKYMKAVLLLNGDTGDGAHNIVGLYDRLKKVAGALLPTDLAQPANLDIQHWRPTTADKFVKRLNDYGDPHNRYLVFGWVTFGQDLHMLDALVFAVRRLAWRLDDPYLPQSDAAAAHKFTFRDLLRRQPTLCLPQNETLEKLISARKQSERRHAALNLNMMFAPEEYEHTSLTSGFAARNPVLFRRVLDPLTSDSVERIEDGIALADWVLASIRLPKDVKDQINAARDHAKRNLPS